LGRAGGSNNRVIERNYSVSVRNPNNNVSYIIGWDAFVPARFAAGATYTFSVSGLVIGAAVSSRRKWVSYSPIPTDLDVTAHRTAHADQHLQAPNSSTRSRRRAMNPSAELRLGRRIERNCRG